MRNIVLAVSVMLLFGACSTSEKYAHNQAATEAWLQANAGRPSIRVDGAWEAMEFGWGGTGRFVQSGNAITGALGNYTARGVVKGTTVYLALNSSGWTYYTAILTLRGGVLGGFYSPSIPFSPEDQGSLNLRRISD